MVILLRYGELALKGQLRRKFENILVSNIRRVMKVENFKGDVRREWGRLYVFSDGDEFRLAKRLSLVFGVVSTSPAYVCNADIEEIVSMARNIFGDRVIGRKFAVRARRSGEHDFTSVDVAKRVGEVLKLSGGHVDLKNPEVEVYVEVRNDKAYLFSEIFRGFGGLPVGTQERVLAMDAISAWFAMRRGCDVDCAERNELLLPWACYRNVNFVDLSFDEAIKSDYSAVFCSYTLEEIKNLNLEDRRMPVLFPFASEEVYTRDEVRKVVEEIGVWI